jgi:hypothetical protein
MTGEPRPRSEAPTTPWLAAVEVDLGRPAARAIGGARGRRLLDVVAARDERFRGPMLVSHPGCSLDLLAFASVHPVDDVRIGRSADNDLAIDDLGVSRRHARVRLEPDGTVVVIDRGSLNGTWLDGERLPAHEPVPITRALAIVRFGPAARLALMDETTFQDYVKSIPPKLAARAAAATQRKAS